MVIHILDARLGQKKNKQYVVVSYNMNYLMTGIYLMFYTVC